MVQTMLRATYAGRNFLSKNSSSFTQWESRWCSSGVVVSEEVREAVASRQPVVALESTIITHGMAFPHNLNTALAVEDIIRKEGAIPATIAIVEGRVHAGLSHSQLQTLATGKGEAVKTSRRDFPYVLTKGLNGGTTVSGTMLVAHKVNIPIFVTGGIGGVHRGGQDSLDVSADLTELGRTPITVVSAGVKSILDVGRTLEYLETQGVCVSVLGDSARFPDFFTIDSGYSAPCHMETPELVASMMVKHKQLGVDSGMLVAVPIPEEHQAQGQLINQAIEQAVKEAESSVGGRDITPFILQRVSELTGGQSLKSNIALIENNARMGARIAVAYSELQKSASSFVPARPSSTPNEGVSSQDLARPVVVGGSIVDFVATIKEPQLKVEHVIQ